MQTVQADDFAANHNLKLTRDANGVLVAEFQSRPFMMTAQAHTECVDSEIKADAPAPCAPVQDSQPQGRRDDHPDVPRSGNGYPTVQQIAEIVAAAVTAALCKSRQERGYSSLTQLDCPSEPSPVYQSADGPLDAHAIGTSTPSAVHSAGNNGQAGGIKPQGTSLAGLKFKLPFPLPTEPGVAAENQASIDVDLGEDGDLESALQRALDSAVKVAGLYTYDVPKEQIPKYDRTAMPNPKSNAAPFTVVPENMGSLFSPPTGFAPPTSIQPAATTESEISPPVLPSLTRYWNAYKADVCLGVSLLIFLFVIVRSFR